MSFDVTSDETKRILDEELKRPARERRGRPRHDGMRSAYTIPELAELAGFTRRQMESRIPASVIKQPRGPRKLRLVHVEDLIHAAPSMWASIIRRQQALGAANEPLEPRDAA